MVVSADIMQSRFQLNNAGLQVTILEGTSEAGKKILISGGKRWYARPELSSPTAFEHWLFLSVLRDFVLWSTSLATRCPSCMCVDLFDKCLGTLPVLGPAG